MGYFSGMDRASATIELKMHDDSRRFRGIGVKHGQAFEKYMVNYFGQKFKVKGEKRLELAHHCYSKPSPIKAEE
jgi:CRISPR-associated endonuclease Csn1